MSTLKRMVSKLTFYLAIIIFAGMILPTIADCAVDRHKPITRELINLIEERPEVGEMLKKLLGVKSLFLTKLLGGGALCGSP